MINTLRELETNNSHIKIAILGTGRMGRAIFYQCSITPGIKCVGISDLVIEKAIDTAKMFGFEYIVIETTKELEQCVKNNIVAVCEDGKLLSNYEPLDVFVDASTEIIDARSIVPFDYSLVIESVKKTGRILLASDACERGSVLKDMAQNILKMNLEKPHIGKVFSFKKLLSALKYFQTGRSIGKVVIIT